MSMNVKRIVYNNTKLEIGEALPDGYIIAKLDADYQFKSDTVIITIFIKSDKTSTGKLMYGYRYISTVKNDVIVVFDVDNYPED